MAAAGVRRGGAGRRTDTIGGLLRRRSSCSLVLEGPLANSYLMVRRWTVWGDEKLAPGN